MSSNYKISAETMALALECTKLQRETVLNIEVKKMSQRQAYIDAGGTAKNDKAADAIVSRMLTDDKVDAFRRALIAESVTDAVMTRQEALERLTRTAKVLITDVCDFRNVEVGKDENDDPVYQTVWTIKDSKDIPPHIAVCIKSVTITKTGPKIELHDQSAAIKQLSDMQGWAASSKLDITHRVVDDGSNEW